MSGTTTHTIDPTTTDPASVPTTDTTVSSTTAGDTTLADRIITGSTLDAVIYADRTGTIRLWNDAATHMFGWTADEAVGKSLELIIPEKMRGAHWSGWDRVMETGATRYDLEPLTAPGVRRDGSRVSLEFSIVMLKDTAGQVEGVAAVLRDVTARWKEDRELKRRVRELEQELTTQFSGTPEQ